MPSKFTKSFGFTLIELLVVISIISLLSSVVVGQTSGARKKGENAKILLQVREYEKALYLYREDFGTFPPIPYTGGTASFYCLGDKPNNPATGCGANGGTPLSNDINFKNDLLRYMSSTPNPNRKMILYNGSNLSTTYRCVNDTGTILAPNPGVGCQRARLTWYLNGDKRTNPASCGASNSRTCCNYNTNTQCIRYIK